MEVAPHAHAHHHIGHHDKSYSSKAIYGVMTILAVLEVMAEHPPTAWRAAIVLFGTTFAVALIDVYAESVSYMVQHGKRPDLREIWREVSPVLVGAQGPSLIMVASAIGLVGIDRAIDIAQVFSFLTLFAFGWKVGRTLHLNAFRQLLSGFVLVAIGALIVGVKVAVH